MTKKVVKASERKLLAQKVVQHNSLSIRQAYLIFAVSESCYRYKAKLSDENIIIANKLLSITDDQKN